MKWSPVLAAVLVGASLSGCASLPRISFGPPPVTRDSHEMANGLLWMQTSAEYRADSLAKYAQAKAMLDAALADRMWTAALEQSGDYAGLPPAVVMDLDETVMDNARFDGEVLKRR